MKISKNRYLQGFGIVVLLLALVRVIFPGVAKPKVAAAGAADSTLVAAKDSAASDASSLRFLMHRLMLKGMWLRT